MRALAGMVTAAALLLPAPAFVLLNAEPQASASQSTAARPLPEADAFYAAVRANLARADREQYRYAYRERRSEVHSNPFGKIGTGGTVTYDVVPGKELGIYQRRLIERDGKPLPIGDQKTETLDRRERGQSNPSIEDVVATLEFKIRGREMLAARECIVVEFAPRKGASPKTRQGKVAKVFKGTVWIDEALHEVVRVDATSIDDMSYGLGFVARLNEGTHATLVREPIDGGVWLPTSVVLKGEGRAILFRKLNIDYVVEWFNYRRTLN
jgi:hypothetical protein